jgi:hypothetical protein
MKDQDAAHGCLRRILAHNILKFLQVLGLLIVRLFDRVNILFDRQRIISRVRVGKIKHVGLHIFAAMQAMHYRFLYLVSRKFPKKITTGAGRTDAKCPRLPFIPNAFCTIRIPAHYVFLGPKKN